MPRPCELCPESKAKPATVYCPADECYLCAACDHIVHSANRLALRHVRRQIIVDDVTDGSSINDDSDAQVPDVSRGSKLRGTASVPTNASSNKEDSVKKTKTDGSSHLPPLNDVSVTFEDAAEYDFCFDSIAPRMVPLAEGDDDNLFSDGKLAKSFYPDLSWDSVVSDAFEHVVPDVAVPTQKDGSDTKIVSIRTSESKRSSGMRVLRAVKNELVEVDMNESKSSVRGVKQEQVVKQEVDEMMTTSQSELKASSNPLPTKGTIEVNREKIGGFDDEADGSEQRRKRRMEALARFRSKRANRSWTKKVRYACRKQLADSRPRSKGRFIKSYRE